jgi:pimeloyl-ACP methyl ester carboxylesterase
LEDRQHERTSAAVAPSRPPSPNIVNVIDRFTEVIGLRRFAIYVFDYGAPVGFRLAVRHLDRITAIISQNGNARQEEDAAIY